jgi:C4-type Zn-finger protein
MWRCADCGWRSAAADTGARTTTPKPHGAMVDPPNLQHSALARTERAVVNLEELDRSIE